MRSKGAGGARGPRQASPRALGIAGGVVLVVIIAIVLALVLGRGSSFQPSLEQTTKALDTAATTCSK